MDWIQLVRVWLCCVQCGVLWPECEEVEHSGEHELSQEVCGSLCLQRTPLCRRWLQWNHRTQLRRGKSHHSHWALFLPPPPLSHQHQFYGVTTCFTRLGMKTKNVCRGLIIPPSFVTIGKCEKKTITCKVLPGEEKELAIVSISLFFHSIYSVFTRLRRNIMTWTMFKTIHFLMEGNTHHSACKKATSLVNNLH